MKVIISPAKKMELSIDTFDYTSLPHFITEAENILKWLKSLSKDELKIIWKCNDSILDLNYERLHKPENPKILTPAVFSYIGLQYQHMAPHVMDTDSLKWLGNHLRIISGLYGLLRPFDGIIPYRLEMQSRLVGFDSPSLYDYWDSKLYDFLCKEETDFVLNLASKEYSKCITVPAKSFCCNENPTQIRPNIVTCVFGQLINDKILEKGTLAKMARGDMIRYLASNNVDDINGIKLYNGLGYKFRDDLSDKDTLVFISDGTIKDKIK